MNYIYGTIKVLHSLDIWKLIKPKGPSKILESYSQDAHECSMEDNSTNIVLLSKIACRSTTNTSSKKYNIFSGYTLLLRKISINRFNIIIQAFFSWYSSISFSEPSILIYYTININLLQEVWLKPWTYQVDIFCVSVREDHRVFRTSVQVEHLDFTTAFGVEVDVIWV